MISMLFLPDVLGTLKAMVADTTPLTWGNLWAIIFFILGAYLAMQLLGAIADVVKDRFFPKEDQASAIVDEVISRLRSSGTKI